MWKQVRVVEERARFLKAARSGELSVSELCRQYGVSRKTGYKWLERANQGEPLEDRSRRPHTSPQRMDEELEELFLELRRARPRLEQQHAGAWILSEPRRQHGARRSAADDDIVPGHVVLPSWPRWFRADGELHAATTPRW